MKTKDLPYFPDNVLKIRKIGRKILGTTHLKTANSGSPAKAPVLMPEKHSKNHLESAGASGDIYENNGSPYMVTDFEGTVGPN